MNGTRAVDVSELSAVESSHKFALAAEARSELLDKADHLSGLDIAVKVMECIYNVWVRISILFDRFNPVFTGI